MKSSASVCIQSFFELSRRAPLALFLLTIASQFVLGQSTFGGNAQHTGIFTPPAQPLNVIKWQTNIDLNNTGALAHYGSPVISANNTVLVPVKTATNGFRVDAFDSATGTLKYSVPSDYIMPSHNWIPSYNICLVGTRLYFAGAGGTMWHIDNVDSNSPTAAVRDVFYTSLTNYLANQASYNNTIFVNTPITADSNGNVFFGFRVQGVAPAPLNTTQSGLARLTSAGDGSFVLVGTAANDPLIDRDSHNAGPALSNDETSVYFPVKSSTNNFYCYLLELSSTTLATKHAVFLRDPRNNLGARITDDATSNPMIAPDGDVYFGVFGNTGNGSRGFLLRFSSDLSVTKTPGAFGWDYTPGIVPASMVASYKGSSSYLLFCKYNDYISADASGINRVAILDPNATQIDPHTSAGGLVEMREVLTIIGPTPDDGGPSFPFAVQEFCINAPAINPATNSVFFDSEDGHIYRWNLVTNSIDQAVSLSAGIGQPYVPTVIGPDGTVYTLNGGNFFALGSKADVKVVIGSSSPDVRQTVFGESVTFTATVSGVGTTPTGNVTFTDLTYDGLVPVLTTLANNVALDANGRASVTTATLAAGGSNLGNHLITATYNGDATHNSSSVTMLQKVHASGTTTVLTSSDNPAAPGAQITFTATVTPTSPIGTPTGMVTFEDGSNSIAQVPLNPSGVASITTSSLSVGTHQIKASYASDTLFASSNATLSQFVGTTRIQFASATTSVTENVGSMQVVVNRTGDTSSTSTVDYATSDTAGPSPCSQVNGVASSRCDYTQTIGRLSFAAGETSKTILVPVIDDVFTEGSESFSITLANPINAAFGGNVQATLTINDNGIEPATNPIDNDVDFFVRQHYLDFLNREPDPAGFDFWKGNITSCGADAQCREVKRINVSAAFFLSIEFQDSGNFIYRLYKGALGRQPTYAEFTTDRSLIPTFDGVPPNKNPLLFDFIRRPEFIAKYPTFLQQANFIDPLLQNIQDKSGVDLTFLRSDLIQTWDACAGGLNDPESCRGPILQRVVDEETFRQAVIRESFVLMEYFGYLRRGPNEPPDSNFDGYNFWLNKLNQFNGNFVQAEMVKAFIQSDEYRHRFGP